jgi:hypothetical protein
MVYNRTPYLPRLQYTYSHRDGVEMEEGRVEPERRFQGQQFTKLGRKTNMSEGISSL